MVVATRIIRPDTAFSKSPIGKKKRPREHDTSHLAFIRKLPCAVCGTHAGVQAAHIRMASAKHGKTEVGGAEKPSDCWTVPLCAAHHVDGPEAQHNVGEAEFWRRHNIDPFVLSLALYRATGDEEMAEVILKEARAK